MEISLFKAKIGEYRYTDKFLFFPKIQAGKLYWLENVVIRQLYDVNIFGYPGWIDVCISNKETGLPIHFPKEKNYNEPIEKTKIRFIKSGVHENKIITTKNPSVCTWSLSRKCLVNELPIKLVKDLLDRNIMVSLLNRSELTKNDISEINESEGIIITNATYGKLYFRYGFIPNNSSISPPE